MRKNIFPKRIFFLVIFLVLFVMSFVFNTNKAFLYSPETVHYNLTQEMVKFYNLVYDPDLTSKQIELILRGSIDEDSLPRPLFHMYDPVYNRAPFGFYTAKKWALENIQSSAIVKFANLILNIFSAEELKTHGDFSWPASVDYFTKGDLDNTYYGLGHILHLIEDMTVPAHSRNDPHLPSDIDPYEIWTDKNSKPENYNWTQQLYNKRYQPIELYIVGKYFDDLAQYSNKYFFSKDTIIKKDYENPKIITERQEDYGLIAQRTYALGLDENGTYIRLAYKDFYESNWSKLSPDQGNANIYKLDETDSKLNTDYWTRLAPKAVQYGAGVIRLFIEEIEYQARFIKKEPELSWFQKAQIFVEDLFGKGEEQNQEYLELTTSPQYLSQPKPMKFPLSEPIIGPLEKPIEAPLPGDLGNKNDLQSPDKKGEIKGESTEKNQGENKGDAIVVTGPKTSGDQGVSREELEKINQLASASDSEDNPVGGEEPPQEPEPSQPPALPPHLIINEVQIRDNEFVELYNSTDTAINLASYSFCYYSSAREWNDPYRNQQFPETASISAGGYYLIGLKGYPQEKGNPDADWQIYDSAQLSNNAGSIAIFPWDPSEKTASEAETDVIDVVAWGGVEDASENISFQEIIGIDKSIQRKNSSQDTNDNSFDFELKKIPSPTNSNNEQRIPGTIIPDDTVISEDTTWTIAGSPYYLELNAGEWAKVEEGVTLTIEPGVIIMPMGGGGITALEIRGTLIAEGTEGEKIVFTSIKDIEYGGIGSASAGDWTNIVFTSTSTNSSFKNVIFRYGGDKYGYQQTYTELLKIDNSSVEMENVVMEKSKSYGLHLINSSSTIKNSIFRDSVIGVLIEGDSDTSIIDGCSFSNNIDYGLKIMSGASPKILNNQFTYNGTVGDQGAIMFFSAYPEFENNQATNNNLNGILIHWQSKFEKDITLEADLPYVLIANSGEYPTITNSFTLTLKPGVILKPFTGPLLTALVVEGTLKAEAASGSEIVFTSLKDDIFGGDTNNDGNTTSPAEGDWSHIKFTASSTGSVLDHVFIYYGSTQPIVVEDGATVDIKDTVSYVP